MWSSHGGYLRGFMKIVYAFSRQDNKDISYDNHWSITVFLKFDMCLMVCLFSGGSC